MTQLNLELTFKPTGPKEWLMSLPPFQRELRAYLRDEVHATRLLGGIGCRIDDNRHLIERAIEALVEDGTLEPTRHFPWFCEPPPLDYTMIPRVMVASINSMYQSCSAARPDTVAAEYGWQSRRSPATEWFYRVLRAPPRRPPTPAQKRAGEWFEDRGWYVHFA